MKKLKTLGLLVPVLVCGFGVSEATKVSSDSGMNVSHSYQMTEEKNINNSYNSRKIDEDFTWEAWEEDPQSIDFTLTINEVSDIEEPLFIQYQKDGSTTPIKEEIASGVIVGERSYYFRFDQTFTYYDVSFIYGEDETNEKRVLVTGKGPTLENIEITTINSSKPIVVRYDYHQNEAIDDILFWRVIGLDTLQGTAFPSEGGFEFDIWNSPDFEVGVDYTMEFLFNPIYGSKTFSEIFRIEHSQPAINTSRILTQGAFSSLLELEMDLDNTVNDLYVKIDNQDEEDVVDYSRVKIIENENLQARLPILIDDLLPNRSYDLTFYMIGFPQGDLNAPVHKTSITTKSFSGADSPLDVDIEVDNQNSGTAKISTIYEGDIDFLDRVELNVKYLDGSSQKIELGKTELTNLESFPNSFMNIDGYSSIVHHFSLDNKYDNINFEDSTAEVIDVFSNSYAITPEVNYLVPFVFPWKILLLVLIILLLLLVGVLQYRRSKEKASWLSISEMQLLSLHQLQEYAAARKYKNINYKESKNEIIFKMIEQKRSLSGNLINALRELDLSEIVEIVTINNLKPPERYLRAKNLLIIWIAQFYEDHKIPMTLKKLQKIKGNSEDIVIKKGVSWVYINKMSIEEQKKYFDEFVFSNPKFEENTFTFSREVEDNRYVIALNSLGKLSTDAHKLYQFDQNYLKVVAQKVYEIIGAMQMSENELKWKVLLFNKLNNLNIQMLVDVKSQEDLQNYVTTTTQILNEQNFDSKALLKAKEAAKADHKAETLRVKEGIRHESK